MIYNYNLPFHAILSSVGHHDLLYSNVFPHHYTHLIFLNYSTASLAARLPTLKLIEYLYYNQLLTIQLHDVPVWGISETYL
jgi:hypothetical protein